MNSDGTNEPRVLGTPLELRAIGSLEVIIAANACCRTVATTPSAALPN